MSLVLYDFQAVIYLHKAKEKTAVLSVKEKYAKDCIYVCVYYKSRFHSLTRQTHTKDRWNIEDISTMRQNIALNITRKLDFVNFRP